MTRRLHIIVDVSDVPGADVETAEDVAENLLSAWGEYHSYPHTAYWEDGCGPECSENHTYLPPCALVHWIEPGEAVVYEDSGTPPGPAQSNELSELARLALHGNRRDVEMYVHRLAYRHRHDALGPALAAVDVVPPVSLREDDDCPGCRRDIVDIDDLKGVYAPHRLGCPWLVDTTEPRESYTRAEVIAILEGNTRETTDD